MLAREYHKHVVRHVCTYLGVGEGGGKLCAGLPTLLLRPAGMNQPAEGSWYERLGRVE